LPWLKFNFGCIKLTPFKRFRPGKKNYVSMIAPVVMIIAFSLLFFEFAKISSQMNEGMEKPQQEKMNE
jgi:hypothetical protein